MENPELVTDIYGRVWCYGSRTNSYRCLSDMGLAHLLLEQLIIKNGPINQLVGGPEVKLPFKPLANGTWIDVDRSELTDTVSGRVRFYDVEKDYYEVVITVPRTIVKETL